LLVAEQESATAKEALEVIKEQAEAIRAEAEREKVSSKHLLDLRSELAKAGVERDRALA
jgi:hypothetical protein